MNNKTSQKIKSTASAFTLIEVLIALAIVAIALTAIVKTTAYDVEDTSYIQQKTVATWVAMNVISEVQLGLITAPQNNQNTQMLMHRWYWSAQLEKTPDRYVDKINVTVQDKPNAKPLVTLWGFKTLS